MEEAYLKPQLIASADEADPLEAIVRRGAREMLQAALEREVEEFLGRRAYERTDAPEEFRGYRNGYHKERGVTVGSGQIEVRVPRVSDTPARHEPFESKIISPYQKRSCAVNELFPKLFVEGLATRDFEPALRSLMGEEAALSPSTISRLNQKFKAEYELWRHSSLKEHRFVYVWADGIHIKAGVGTENAAALVVIGVDAAGVKHFLALEEGFRESKQSWLEVLRALRERGMNEPALCVADGALGFWAAVPEVWTQTKAQRCWFHKAANILDKLPRAERAEAAQRLRAIYRASSRAEAERLARLLIAEWRAVHYVKAADCLSVDLAACLAFFDYPQEHWKHLRTTNPIESVFASIRLRTDAAKRFRTARSGVHLIFQLLKRCEQSWQRLSAPERLRVVRMPGDQAEVSVAASQQLETAA